MLAKFEKDEADEAERMIIRAADASELFVTDGIAAVIAALDAVAAETGVGGHAEQIEVDQEGVRILRSVGVL